VFDRYLAREIPGGPDPGPDSTAVDHYDLIVLGAGAAGLGAARAARRADRTVALVEAAEPGGDCTFYGCVPTKTLLETARRVHAARSGAAYGFSAAVRVDFATVMRRVSATIEEIAADESPKVLAGEGIELVRGTACFVEPAVVAVGSRRLSAERFVLATGAVADIPPIEGLRESGYLDHRTILALTELPEHLVILGGGPLGTEFAQAFARLGSRVTMIQRGERLLPRDEPEASSALRQVLEREGVRVLTGCAAVGVESGPSVLLADGTTVAGSHLLAALGRRPVTDGLALDVPGVALTQRGAVAVDEHLRTSAQHVYAVGDCATDLRFTHVGDEQGRLAVRNAFAPGWRPRVAGGAATWEGDEIPWVTFTDPEVAHVGLTEAQAFARYGEAARVSVVPMSSQDRARCAGETDGFVKLVAAPGPLVKARPLLRLVGMTAVAPYAGELIAEGALAISTGMLAGRIAQTVHAYPTWSITTRVAAALFFGSYGGHTARPARSG